MKEITCDSRLSFYSSVPTQNNNWAAYLITFQTQGCYRNKLDCFELFLESVPAVSSKHKFLKETDPPGTLSGFYDCKMLHRT